MQHKNIDIICLYLLFNFLFQEPGEAINKDLKSFQLNHAPQTSALDRNLATFNRLMDRSDPEVLRHYNKAARKALDRARKPYSDKVLALCISGSDYVHSFWVMMIEWQGYSFHFCVYSFKICPTLQ